MSDRPAASERLFERDLAAILSCDSGAVQTVRRVRRGELWFLALIGAAFAGLLVIASQNVRQIEFTKVAPSGVESERARPNPAREPPKAAATMVRRDDAAAVLVEREEVVTSPAAQRERRRSVGRGPVARQTAVRRAPAEPVAADLFDRQTMQETTDAAPIATTNAALEEKQRQDRLEALDAVRSLRLH